MRHAQFTSCRNLLAMLLVASACTCSLGSISSYAYTLDNAGHRTRVIETLGDPNASNFRKRVVGYTYDTLYRLVSEEATVSNKAGLVVYERTVSYVYDERGNREQMTVSTSTGGSTQTYDVFYTYNVWDQLVSEQRNDHELAAFWPADGDVSRYDRSMFAKSVPPKYAPHGVAAYFGVLLLFMSTAFFVAWGPKRRGRSKRLLHTTICLFFVPVFIFDPSNLAELNNWAMTRTAMAAPSQDDEVIRYTYDGNGNLAVKRHDVDGIDVEDPNDSRETYLYNAENVLKQYKNFPPNDGQVETTTYYHDHANHRIGKLTVGAWVTHTRQIVDTSGGLSHIVAEINGRNGELVKRYVFGDDLLTQTDGSGNRDYFHTDGQMSTRHLTSDAPQHANVAETHRFTYDAFGEQLDVDGLSYVAQGASGDTSYRYTGEQYDGESGLYHLRARQYDPLTGRFGGRDAWGGDTALPLSQNLYAYVHGNPVNYIDPTGLFATIGGAIAAVSIQGFTGAILLGSITHAYVGSKIVTGVGAFLSALVNPDTWLFAFTALITPILEIFSDPGEFIRNVAISILSKIIPFASIALSIWNTLRTVSAIREIITADLSAELIGTIFARVFAIILVTMAISLLIGAVMDRVALSAAKGTGTITVSRYGRDGLVPGDWVMIGRPSLLNWFRSGKWQPGFGNKFASPSTGRKYDIPIDSLKLPKTVPGNYLFDWGPFANLKSIIFGQRRYMP